MALRRKYDQMFMKAYRKLRKSGIGKDMAASFRHCNACIEKEKTNLVNLGRHYHSNDIIRFPGSV
jgi:hypothetical protein